MDIRNKDAAADRDLAAKRTSENTALAAQKAYENGYQPHRKSNWLRVDETPDPAVPFTGTTPYDPALYGLKPVSNPPKDKPTAQATGPLVPEEVKEHQARLLTLLRSLQPVRVVDQLCKALAYFGGIPDAPPPQGGKFPDSAEANGSGAIFVGWLAEIFPDVDAQGRRKPRPLRAPVPPTEQSPEKRGRGRPKGSKASKVRSDKGIKKGPKKTLTEALEADGPEHDNSWVDVDETIRDGDQDVVITGAQAQQTPDPEAAADAEATGSSKKRGRPKGSKNRSRDGAADEYAPNPAPISALFSIGKKTAGRPGPRPKSAKARAKDAEATCNTVTAPINGATPVTAPEHQAPAPQPAATMEPSPQADPEFALAALKAFNEAHSNGLETPATSFQPVNNASLAHEPQVTSGKKSTAKTTAKSNGKAQPAKKRKRNVKDAEAVDQPVANSAVANTVVVNAPGTFLTQPSASVVQETSTEDSSAAAPPPKRQRKTKAKSKTATNSASAADQPVTLGTSQISQTPVVPAAPASQPTDAQMYTSPTIEELEAQLEQDDEQSLAHPGANTVQDTRQAQPSPLDPSQPSVQQLQPQQATNPKKVQQIQQKSDQQRAMARQRQYQQQQQHAVTRTASPNVSQVNTASPHVSVQPASPVMNQAHAASPNLQQQRTSNSQTPTSMGPQIQSQQTRNAQSYYTPQTTTSTPSSYGQQQDQQYSSPQPAKQQFAVPQPQQQQSYSTTQQPSQQNQSYTSQQPQYSQQKNQTYSSQSQSHYSPPQQQYSSQQRVQQQQQPYAAASASTASQSLTAQSPQYGTSTNDGGFRTNSATSMNFNSNAYSSNQTQSTSRNSSVYPASSSSYGNPTQQISSYATAPRRALPTTTSHQNPVQSVQSLPQNLNNFSDFGNLGFDGSLMSSLDSSTAGHSNLAMNTAPYNMAAGSVSRSSTGASNFGFDSSLRNDGSSYFGLRR